MNLDDSEVTGPQDGSMRSDSIVSHNSEQMSEQDAFDLNIHDGRRG